MIFYGLWNYIGLTSLYHNQQKENKMFLALILLFMVPVFSGVLFYKTREYFGDENLKGFTSFFSICICVIFTIWIIILICCKGSDYLQKTVQFQKYQNEKSLTQRLLLEDYNPSNLEKALIFNNTQKLIKAENSNWWTAYKTSFVYVDTIPIPTTNFMPSQKIVIKSE